MCDILSRHMADKQMFTLILAHLSLNKMTAILADDKFKGIFLNRNDIINSNFTEIRSHESNWQYASIGSGYG